MSTRSIGNYLVGETLGEGGFARVKLGTHKDTGEKVALKVLAKKSIDPASSEMKQVKKEIAALKVLKHPNILRMIDVDWEAKYPKADGGVQDVLLIVLELAAAGELFDFLSFTGCFDEKVARTYFHQLIAGLKECHSNGIAHRDLKPENLLLGTDFVLKIADFGLSHVQSDGNTRHVMKTECGTKGYSAPEVLNGKHYYESADIFSAGVILFIMLAGFPPFQIALKHDWWFAKLMLDKHSLFWKAHERNAYFSDAAKDLINKILTPDPSKRISIAQIYEHEWFKGPILTSEELVQDLSARKNVVERQKKQEKDGNAPKRTKLIELGDSYTNKSVLGADGLPLQDPLLLMTSSSSSGKPELLDAFSKIETYSQSSSLPVYTSFETSLMPTSILRVLQELLNVTGCSYNLDKEQLGTLIGKFESKVPLIEIPKDLLEIEHGSNGNFIIPMNAPSDSKIQFSIRVFQHGVDANTRVVVFRRLDGSAVLFNRFYQDIVETLNDWKYVKHQE